MANFIYQLLYAGTPFVSDAADNAGVRMPSPRTPYGQESDPRLSIYKQQSLPDLFDEINRLLPQDVLNDFCLPQFREGNKLDALAYPWLRGPKPDPQLKVGDWYYPTGAGRFGVFRGVATSAMTKAMLAATNGSTSATFTMQAVPQGAINSGTYLVETNMFMLPPRPLGELNVGAGFDGLYLITRVDERYWFQYSPVSLQPTQNATWTSLINQCATALGISVTIPTIPTAYGTRPASDSQIWVDQENAAFLLDALAYSLGMVVVRNLDGSYTLQTASSAITQVNSNRGTSTQVVRQAGGEFFASGTLLPVGDLHASRNAAVPENLQVSFSKYVTGSGPCPHYINPRYNEPQVTSWFEQSHGDSYNISVAASSVGSLVSGIVGTTGYTHTIHTTAKALYPTEAAAFTGTPDNAADLNNLATQIAQDYYFYQVGAGQDEVYPGTLLWAPEGFHDIIWTYSDKRLGARTRVMRTQWNNLVREMQHGTMVGGANVITSGAGGHSVAQTWFDQSGNTVYGVNCVTVLGATVSGKNYSGGVEQLFLTIPASQQTSGVPWTAGYVDNSLLVSGMKLLRFDGSGFILSGYTASGDVDVYHYYGVSGDIQSVGFVNLPGTLGKVARADHVHSISGAITSGTIASGAISSGTIASGIYIILASGLPLATINQDGTQFNFPVNLLVAADTLSTATSGYRFGRILFTNGATSGTIGVASGKAKTTEIDWEGLRLYHAGYVGPEPDIEFIDSASVTWTVADDPGNGRVTATATATTAAATKRSAMTVLNTNVNISGSTTLKTVTNATIQIPVSGIYHLTYDVCTQMRGSTGSLIETQLTDTTNSIPVSGTYRRPLHVPDAAPLSGTLQEGNASASVIYTGSGGGSGNIIALQAAYAVTLTPLSIVVLGGGATNATATGPTVIALHQI